MGSFGAKGTCEKNEYVVSLSEDKAEAEMRLAQCCPSSTDLAPFASLVARIADDTVVRVCRLIHS